MNKAKKILLSVLSAACVGVAALGVAACGADVVTTTPVVKYYVGDNADVFDFIQYESGYDYSFTYTIDGGEEIELEGESIYLEVEGEYKVTVKVDGKEATTFIFNVYNPVPHIMLNVKETVMPLDQKRSQRAVINMASPKVISDVEYENYVESVLIYKDPDAEPELVEIKEGVPTSDGFWDGNRFNFIYECEHIFNIVAESSGGKATVEFKVSVEEYLDDLPDLGEPIYNRQTRVVSWDPVEGAASYRVKFGTVAYETEDASVLFADADDHVHREFAYFDIAVIPKDAEGEKMGKMIYKNVVIAPEGHETFVKGRGITALDTENQQVTLLGGQCYTSGWSTGMDLLNNSHIAFADNYGLNTFVEFTFKGNNMPNVAFFADDINGNLTKNGGMGYILMNGLFSFTDDYTVGANRLVVVGPNRFSSDNYKSVSERYPANYTMSVDSLFTQKGLEEDITGRTYRYVVGAVDIAGKLGFQAKLYVEGTDELVAEATYQTKTAATDAGYGNIIAYAAVKGNGKDTTFGYSMPYHLSTELVGGRQNTDGSVTLDGRTAEADSADEVSAVDNSYLAFKGSYGVGKYVNAYFTGNNMPNVLFFADDVSGNMTSDGGKGLLIMNGLGEDEDKLVVFGMDRMSNGGASASENGYLDNANKLFEITDCPLLTKAGLKADTSGTKYKLCAGTYEAGGYLFVDIQLSNADTGEMIYSKQIETEILASSVEKGKTVLYGAMNGEQSPITLTYDAPYVKEWEVIQTSGVAFNEDDSVTLTGVRPVHAGYGSGVGSPSGATNSYLGWNDKQYGVGYKMDFYYTGNNMPYVMLFADSVDGYMGGNRATDKGIILMNGITSAGNTNVVKDQFDHLVYGDIFTVWGPNRYKGYEAGNKTYLYAFEQYPALTQAGLISDEWKDTDFHYVVGSFLHPITNTVYLDVQLYTVAADGTETELYKFGINTQMTEAQLPGSSIVVYAPMKGQNQDSTFTFKSPYAYEKDTSELGAVTVGVTENQDGSVTIAGGDDLAGLSYTGVVQGVGYGSGMGRFKNNYIGLIGGHGVGTYVATQFTGDNMPQVTLFAGDINGWMAIGHASYADGAPVGQTGYLITDGVASYGSSITHYMEFLYCSGPNRISQNLNVPTESNFTFTQGAYTALEETKTYTYVVGSYLKEDKVMIEATLYDASGAVIYSGEYATGKTQAEAEALGGHILLFAGVKGCPVEQPARGTPYSTTFYYAEPFTAEPTYAQASEAINEKKA